MPPRHQGFRNALTTFLTPQPLMGVLDPYGRDIIKRRSKTFGTISVLIPILLHFDVLIDNFSILQYYTSKYYFSPDKTVCLTKD